MNFVDQLFDEQREKNPEAYEAMCILRERGLGFCTHFGYANAVDLLAEMNAACEAGTLYDWMAKRCGLAGQP